jgi:hypothetical protein
MALFEIGWGGHKIGVEQSAVAEVNKLDRRVVVDPGFAGVVEKIISYHTLDVATLEPDRITASRRGIERVVTEFGEARTKTITVMDVRIPFRGIPQSFNLSPTYCSLPSEPCEVNSDHLLVTFRDDADVQSNVDKFVQIISQNLTALKAEVTAWLPQLRARVEEAANARKKEIAAQNERDKNLRFKVEG